MTRYRSQLGGQTAPDVLLVRLMHVPGRPLVSLHLPAEVEPSGLSELWPLETAIHSEDEPGEHMSGDLELPDGSLLSQSG